MPVQGVWPNHATWGALKNESTLSTEDGLRYLWTVPCGELGLPSGRLVAGDPFVFLSPTDTPFIVVPRGKFPVVVTLADVSDKQDRSHIREAYASIIFSAHTEAYRKALPLAKDGENLILFHSGWGDGCYPVVGSFDSSGRLVAAHIDFFVIK